MRESIHVSRSLAPVTMPARLLNEISEHARESFPEECCGLMLGKGSGCFEAARRCKNDMTALHGRDPLTYPRDGRRAFHMNELDYQKVQREADAQGALVTAVYHSHVDAGLYFSESDQAFATQPGFPFPRAWHIVISVFDRRVRECAVFMRADGAETFEGRMLEPEVS